MKLASKSTLMASALAATVLLGGCASNSELAEVRAAAERAQQTADAANQKADQALQAAQTADANATAAMNKANEVDEKVERMFKKGMMK